MFATFKKILTSKILSWPVKIITAICLLAGFTALIYYLVDEHLQRQRIANAIDELENYQAILQDYYTKHGTLPPVGVIFPQVLNPAARSGCDIAGSCPTYYERVLNHPNRAFMVKLVSDIDMPNLVYVGFEVNNKKIVVYCGPWTHYNQASVQVDRLPRTCRHEIKTILGL